MTPARRNQAIGILIAFALGIAVAAARGVSRPIQELADTTHQIAA